MGNSLVCPNCGSTDVYCGGLDPVRSLAKCRCCGCYAEGMLRIDQLFSSSRTASDRNQALKDEEKRRLSEEERRKSLSLSRTECERRGGSERRAAATNGPQGSRVVWGIAIVLNAGRMSFICNLQRTVREGRVKPSLTFVERITVDWICVIAAAEKCA